MSAPPILTHRLEGEGQPLLLLNGGLMTLAAWEPVARHLRRRFRVLRCDLRGQLLSPGAAHDELSGNVNDLVALLDALELDAVHVVGTSFGAQVGLLLTALEVTRVRSLIAVTATDYATESMLHGAGEMRQVVAEIAAGGDRGRLHDLLVRDIYSSAWVETHGAELLARRDLLGKLPATWFQGLDGILTCTETLDLRPQLARVRCPTLVVLAAQDRVMTRERSCALAAAIGNAEMAEHPTSGHALVVEDPEWLAQTCLEFLDRVAQRGDQKSATEEVP